MPPLIPYPAVEHHGVIGDRRTAALVSADGAVDWLCLPDYDGHVVFGALLDARRGGFWRIGPRALVTGEQQYDDDSAVLTTRWRTATGALELVDAMAMPQDERGAADRRARTLLRRVACTGGEAECVSDFRPSLDFVPIEPGRDAILEGAIGSYVVWSSHPSLRAPHGSLHMRAGDVAWMVLAVCLGGGWTTARAERLLADTRAYWTSTLDRLGGPSLDRRIARSALTIRLLEYAPSGSLVAAPTTSLPERIGGSWNADYRLTWVRDASLSTSALALLGDTRSAVRFLDWLAGLDSSTDQPRQVCYTIRGGTDAHQSERADLDGYRGSKPVRFGNHAFRQRQLDSFGYLADCANDYLEQGGAWSDELWCLLRRAAGYLVDHWQDTGHGIWEIQTRQRYVSSHVMAWTALDRVLRIAARRGMRLDEGERWRQTADRIRDVVLTRGWSAAQGAFSQALDGDVLDASTLLIPKMGLLPPDDPRVLATVDRVRERLAIDGCVYRFDPEAVPDLSDPLPMGQFEGAFAPCTFWLAEVLAMTGRPREGEAIVAAVERIAGPLGLMAEGIDPRARTFLGNSPLLFSHVAHIHARRAIEHAS